MEAIPAILSVCIADGGLKAAVGLRLDPEQEFKGPDRVIHRISASPERETAW